MDHGKLHVPKDRRSLLCLIIIINRYPQCAADMYVTNQKRDVAITASTGRTHPPNSRTRQHGLSIQIDYLLAIDEVCAVK